jgi:3,4-dihydroxy 2-butanone 4-phosphate synthase/GTP cyclohydrolase II
MILTVEEAIIWTREGRIFIIVDNDDREDEGDFFVATDNLAPEIVNFMSKEGRGLICISLPRERLEKLEMKEMCEVNSSFMTTAFYCSCEAVSGVTTGISAFDRSLTMKKLIEDGSIHDDFVYPGHCFPLMAKDLGVIERQGHTEAATDLASLAGLKPSGVIVEILSNNGRMAKMPELKEISDRFGMGILTIKSLVEYRIKNGLTESLYQKW